MPASLHFMLRLYFPLFCTDVELNKDCQPLVGDYLDFHPNFHPIPPGMD